MARKRATATQPTLYDIKWFTFFFSVSFSLYAEEKMNVYAQTRIKMNIDAFVRG